jgi:hypothetical protein
MYTVYVSLNIRNRTMTNIFTHTAWWTLHFTDFEYSELFISSLADVKYSVRVVEKGKYLIAKVNRSKNVLRRLGKTIIPTSRLERWTNTVTGTLSRFEYFHFAQTPNKL